MGGGEAWRVQGWEKEGGSGREALLLFGSKSVTRFLLSPSGPLRPARHGGVIGLAQVRAVSEVVGLSRLVGIASSVVQRVAYVTAQVACCECSG